MDFQMPEGNEYQVWDNLNGKQGFFLWVNQPITLRLTGSGEAILSMAIDRTAQMENLNQVYASEKSNLIKKQIWLTIIVLIIVLLLSYLVVWLLIKHYVIDPITELTITADKILNNTFTGEIIVKEGSVYANLQRLLKSGVLVLTKST
jgi:hypothetical protein